MKLATIVVSNCHNCPFRKDMICCKLGREVVYPSYWDDCDKEFPRWCPLKEYEG